MDFWYVLSDPANAFHSAHLLTPDPCLSPLVNGNWNCVCNAGCLIGALAIVDEDTTNTAQTVITDSITNIQGNCATAVYDDGTWTETPNYWCVPHPRSGNSTSSGSLKSLC